jgi:hypothetical protein
MIFQSILKRKYVIALQFFNSIELSPFWETIGSQSENLLNFLEKGVQHSFHKYPLLDLILGQMNPLHTITFFLYSVF